MERTLDGLCDRLETIASTLLVITGGGAALPCGCSGANGAALACTHSARQGSITSIGGEQHIGTGEAVSHHRPDVAFVEKLLAARKRCHSLLDSDLLFDPAWWMLVDLYCAELKGKKLSVTAVTIGSGVPDTTALRYLRVLEERGYIQRVPDENDKRRLFVTISRPIFKAMSDYMAALEADMVVTRWAA